MSQIDVHEMLGPELMRNSIISSTDSFINGKVIGLLFSASWCPACVAFTPSLTKTYDLLKAEGKQFEVILVSFDEDKDKFQMYASKMPWPVLPFDPSHSKAVAKQLGVIQLPTLVIIDANGRVLSNNAKSAAAEKPQDFPWEEYEERKPAEWEVAIGGLKLAGIFVLVLSFILWLCYRGLKFTFRPARGLLLGSASTSLLWGAMVLLAVGLLVLYVLWKVGGMLHALIPILVKIYKEETKKEEVAKRESNAAKETSNSDAESHCTDGVCALPKRKAV